MIKSPNLATCTAEEWAEWVLQTKREQGVIMYSDTFITADMLHKITKAYRIVGYKEGYKRGKRNGSYAGYNIGYTRGFQDGYSECVRERVLEDDYWDEVK